MKSRSKEGQGGAWNRKEGLKPPVGMGPTLTRSVSASGSSGPSGRLTQTQAQCVSSQ